MLPGEQRGSKVLEEREAGKAWTTSLEPLADGCRRRKGIGRILW